jgi:methylenetetrahydrofolate reductase (NADPH)
VFAAERFAVTAEISPPKSPNPEIVRQHTRMLKDYQEGAEPILQMTCRDRNRIALQSDLLGAAALGVKNVLCLSGDHQTFGNQRESKNVYDIDPIQELQIFRMMRDEKKVWGGDELEEAPKVFLGAVENPFADPFESRVTRLAKKVAAGAEFIQTQAIFDMDRFERWMNDVRDRGLDERVHVLGGVVPLRSLGAAKYMKTKVPGMIIPDDIMERMRKATDPKSEGMKICLEKIEHLRTIKGVHGVHIMAINWEEKIPEIVQRAGLYPRPIF